MNLEDDLQKLFADKEAFDVPVAEDAAGAVVEGARRRRKRRRAVTGTAGALTVAAVVGVGVAIAGNGGPSGAPPAAPVLSVVGTASPSTITKETVPTGPAKATASGKISAPSRTHHPTTRHTSQAPPTDTEPAPPANPMAFGPTSFDGVSLGMAQADAEATGVITKNATSDAITGCTGYDWTGIERPAGEYAVLISDATGVVRISGLSNAVTPEGIYHGVSAEKVRAAYPDGSGDDTSWLAPVPGNPSLRYVFSFTDARVSSLQLLMPGSDCTL